MTSAALRSRAWKLLEMVTTPLLPSDYLDLVSPLRAGADLRGRIEAVHPETGDEVADHTTNALWLGDKLAINVDFLRAHAGG